MGSTAEDYFAPTDADADADESFKDYLKAMAIVERPEFAAGGGSMQLGSGHGRGHLGTVATAIGGPLPAPPMAHMMESQGGHGAHASPHGTAHEAPLAGPPAGVKKCSRCRMKRVHESELDLHKYQTCAQCRAKRKVKERRPRQLTRLPNVCDNWAKYLARVAMNHQVDLHQHNFRAYTDEESFPRYAPEELTLPLVQEIGERVIQAYVLPLQRVTGFKFAIRDHHNPQLADLTKAKKITWMYICSQDRTRRRKSRSENKRQIINKLKTEDCESKINLSYDLVNGIIQMGYNHKHHKPAGGAPKGIAEASQASAPPRAAPTLLPDDIYTSLTEDKSIHQQFQELQKQHQLLQTEEEEEEQRYYDSKDVVNVASAAVAVVAGSNSQEARSSSQPTPMGRESLGEAMNSPSRRVPQRPRAPHQDSFDMGLDDNYDDAASVAEIARLLKQVQSTAKQDTAGLEEIASLVGLGAEDLSLLTDSPYNHNLLEQVREQVRRGQHKDEDL